MAYVAIVLHTASVAAVKETAFRMGLINGLDRVIAHHVTLAMGRASGFAIGKPRKMTVTHCGVIGGRVAAFRVAGAEDSKNAVPHVTIAVNSKIGAKPFESNKIAEWIPIPKPFDIFGTIEICD